jgi:hypothetical protein
VLVVVVVAVRFIPILQGWISEHDQHPGSGQFLLRPRPAQGLKQIFYLLAFVDGLTLPLAIMGAVGVYLVWRDRDRSLGRLLLCLCAFPIAFLTLISLRTPVSTYYLIPAVPVFFLGAAAFVDRLLRAESDLQPRWLLPAVLVALVIAAGAPTLISDYRDGRRYDFRAAAQVLQPHIAPGDVVFSDQPMVLAHYLAGTKVNRLRDLAPLKQAIRLLYRSRGGEALWIVAPAPSHAFRANLKSGGLIRWIYDNCELRNVLGVGRLDLRQQYLQVYRCSSTSPAGDADKDTVAPQVRTPRSQGLSSPGQDDKS